MTQGQSNVTQNTRVVVRMCQELTSLQLITSITFVLKTTTAIFLLSNRWKFQCRQPNKNMQDDISEYKLLSKMVSDVGTNFISGKFESFCKKLSIRHAVLLSYNHPSNGQAGACNVCKQNNEKIL